jgi:hypothetical protein
LLPIWEIDILFALRQCALEENEENEENQDEVHIRTDRDRES